jgi:hypothetical protein
MIFMSAKVFSLILGPIFLVFIFAVIFLKKREKSKAAGQTHRPHTPGAGYDAAEIERSKATGRSISDNSFGG